MVKNPIRVHQAVQVSSITHVMINVTEHDRSLDLISYFLHSEPSLTRAVPWWPSSWTSHAVHPSMNEHSLVHISVIEGQGKGALEGQGLGIRSHCREYAQGTTTPVQWQLLTRSVR